MAKSTTKNKTATKKTAAKKTTVKKTTAKKSVAKSRVKKTADKKTAPKTKAVKPKKAAAPKSAAKAKVVIKAKSTTKAKAVTKAKSAPKARKTTTKSTRRTKTGRTVEVVSAVTKTPKQIKGYSKKDLDEFKKVILDKRAEIIEQLQNLKDQMMDATTGQYVNENSPYSLHMAEQGTDAQEREKLYLWAQRETKFLGYLEDALQRIDNGIYGICIDSLELREGPHLIPKQRLLAVPHTSHCVECKNRAKK
jgi:RNA polymerase-binding transcription factor DksA